MYAIYRAIRKIRKAIIMELLDQSAQIHNKVMEITHKFVTQAIAITAQQKSFYQTTLNQLYERQKVLDAEVVRVSGKAYSSPKGENTKKT
jgi:hypothetical protein